VGRLFYLQNSLSKAKKFGLIGLEFAKNVESPKNIQGAAKLLSDIYGDEGKGMKAFKMYKLYTSMRDSINNNKNQKAIIQQNIKYQYQKEKAIDDGERDNLMAIEQKENEKQQVIIYAIGFGLLIVLLFSFIIYNKLKVTGKQKALIEVQNKEIVDSITYAKRIQEAILPTLSVFEEKFPKSFIYYKPKDIISGDFYWLETSESVGLKALENEGELVSPTPQSPSLIFFAVADCTGHGVPGAMVSVVCNNALNSCIKEFKLTDPGEILNKTRAIVAEQFNESTASSYIRDGMDIALCAFDPITKIIKYAGAYNPLWVFRNGTQQLEEFKATRQTVGKVDGETSFKTHTVKVQSGDHIYLFSDGFSDQFGGEKGKKMKSKLFKELLHSISNQSMEEQRNIIDNHFENWRGDHEQVDDVCVMGIRI
jgi:serine phosphatase RsbU (regulator of sigma subunit)